MKRGFMCAPGFSGFSNTSSVGAWNSAGIVKTMLTSIGTGSSPCRSFSLPGLLLPESGLRLPDFGWQFPHSGLLPSPDLGLSSVTPTFYKNKFFANIEVHIGCI
jgi:hypothetical protein